MRSQYLKNVETAMNLFTINKTLQHNRANITKTIRQKEKINAKIYCALKENIYIIIIVFTTTVNLLNYVYLHCFKIRNKILEIQVKYLNN